MHVALPQYINIQQINSCQYMRFLRTKQFLKRTIGIRRYTETQPKHDCVVFLQNRKST